MRHNDSGALVGCAVYAIFSIVSFLVCVVLPYAIIAHFVLKYW